MVSLTPEKNSSVEQAKQNCAFLNGEDYSDLQKQVDTTIVYITINGVVLLVKSDKDCPKGKILLNANIRKQVRASLLNNVNVEAYQPKSNQFMEECTVNLVPRKPPTEIQTIDTDDLLKSAVQQLIHRPVYQAQPYCLDYGAQSYDLIPKTLSDFKIVAQTSIIKFSVPHPHSKNLHLSGSYTEAAVVKETQLMQFIKQTKELQEKKLKNNNEENEDLPQEEDEIQLDIEFMGVGGCNKQFAAIFRRAFVPRLLPPQLVRQYNMQMVRGLILYGPPGTGKTLIARKIGEILNAKEPKIISGPEILNAYVGKSEENIRDLFKDAEKEYEEKGEDSELHIIIMDELDAICKQRGSRSDSTGTHDSIVNQLLAKMDGVKPLNNILVIGMTNRLDLMDEALLRPGRFEVQVEIHLPDRIGRLQILRIHTRLYKEKNSLCEDVNLEELAELTPNYSGAEILGVVNAALSYAQTRMINAQAALTGQQYDLKEFSLKMKDFTRALQQVKASFGKCDEKIIGRVQQMGFLQKCNFQKHMDDILQYIKTIQNSNIKLGTILLHSDCAGTGKSSIAAQIAKQCGIEFTKFISAENLVLRAATEMERANTIVKAFQDAYKVPEALIILDGIEDIIMYTSEGMRFSNTILTTLIPLLKRGDGRIIVIGTTSKFLGMSALDVNKCFYKQIAIKGLEIDQLKEIQEEWCQEKNVKWAGGDVRELECVQEREIITVRAFLQTLEQAAAGRQEILEEDFVKAFETTW